MNYKLVLENGREFVGLNFGSPNETIGEIFFSTSMVGYQDLLSDPSYFGKIVCMSYPLIGNYGLTDEDYDFKNIHIRGYIVKENNDIPSNFRSTRTLSDAMEENHVVGLSDVDTREIVKIIRDEGLMKAMITKEDLPLQDCLEKLNQYQEINNPVEIVSCKKIWYSRTFNPLHTVVIIDLGIKTTLVKKINEYGLNAIVVPYNTTLEQIKKLKPNGIIISNGPGNPNKLEGIKELIIALKGKYPILGLGLGAQILSLTYGAEVYKMKHGHQGANLPVRNIIDDTIEITSQNHFYGINMEEKDNIKITHRSVVDNDIEGFIDVKNKIIGVQYLIQETLSVNENILIRFINNMKK